VPPSHAHGVGGRGGADDTHRSPPTFSTLAQLKAHVTRSHKLHMCDICLEGRKVFLSEQEMYSKADLERHNTGTTVHLPSRHRRFPQVRVYLSPRETAARRGVASSGSEPHTLLTTLLVRDKCALY